MTKKQNGSAFLENSKAELSRLIKENQLENIDVSVIVKPLTAQEAIGQPERRDFPIIEGKERVIEAQVLGAKGHAFTDSPGEFVGILEQVLALPLTTNENRAVFVAALNATLRYLGLCEGTVHCKNDEPTRCGKEIANHILANSGKIKVGLIGFNPTIADALIQTFGSDAVKITDLNPKNIDCLKYGVEIWDGKEMTERLIDQSDVVLVTGTTLVNATFDSTINCIRNCNKDYVIYGVTCAGVCKLMQFNRICPYARSH